MPSEPPPSSPHSWQPSAGRLSPGDVFADFVIEQQIGLGEMGIVYRARQREPDRVVALKVVAPEVAGDPSFEARFKSEGRIAARIEHPNVIPVYAVGEDRGTLYIAMRFVVGTDLRAVIEEDGRVEPGRAAALIDQVGPGARRRAPTWARPSRRQAGEYLAHRPRRT